MVEITGFVVFSSNSAELASLIPAILRAASITMHCKPRHKPSVGILFSRAYFNAPSFPSIPRTPKPPGTQIASTSPRLAAASLSVAQLSLGTHLMFTLAKLAKPPARSASVTDR
ncbi:unannotated protein [freshwater metagenome]|uniref:Unannotated protein n=1 Tax=freshwater metagenome TaxID=449393 RepID=A0A6J6PCK6_9ZZZZ